MRRQTDGLLKNAREAARTHISHGPEFSERKVAGEILIDVIQDQPQPPLSNRAGARIDGMTVQCDNP